MNTPSAQSWSALVENEIGIEKFFASVLCTLAVHEHALKEQDGGEAPNVDDALQIYTELTNNKIPGWWPDHFGRIELVVKSTPDDGSGSDSKGPVPVDPNTPDYGLRTFKTMLINLLDALGSPYEGTIEIRTRRVSSNEYLGTTKHHIAVEMGGHKGGHGGQVASDRWVDKELKWQTEQRQEATHSMITMFNQASSVIGASAQALQATRGVNMAPPMEGSGDSPMWQQLMQGGLLILEHFNRSRGDHSAADRLRQVATMPMPGMIQGGYGGGYMPQGGGYAHPLLADPSGPPPLLDQPVLPNGDGEYEGFFVKDEFMVDEAAVLEDEDGEGGEEVEVDPDAMLDELDPEEVGSLIERWIDRHPEQRDAVREMGMNLARKII